MEALLLYHGARRWSGRPEVRRSRPKRSEHGPGIYLTTSRETAQRYAKGGGRVYQFALDPSLSWLEDHRIALFEMELFLGSIPRLRHRAEIINDLHVYRLRTGCIGEDLPAETLVNLMVNYDALGGEAGTLLAEFLVDHGIDASIDQRGNEDWVVLFNPRKVLDFGPVERDAPWDVPRVPWSRR